MARGREFDVFAHGIYRSFKSGADAIASTTWNRAAGSGEHVGTCRWCGDYLLAEPTHKTEKITWYSARCTNSACLRIIAAPNGAILRRSGRHEEMPSGYWEQRTQKGA